MGWSQGNSPASRTSCPWHLGQVPVWLASRLRGALQDDEGLGRFRPRGTNRTEIFIRSHLTYRLRPAVLLVSGSVSSSGQCRPSTRGRLSGRAVVSALSTAAAADSFSFASQTGMLFPILPMAYPRREGSWPWNLPVSDVTGSSVLTTANISSSMTSVTCGQFGRRGSSRATACSDSISR